MKRTFNSVLVTGLLLALTSAARAQTPANLAYLDDGGGNPIAPTPGPDDQSQLTTGGVSNPPGFNYYVNNNPAPGQTFTTGSNPGGYILNSLSVFEPGNSGGQPNGGQAYLLRIYTVSGSSATLYASYISPNNVFLYDTYWYQWTNLNNLTLLPNTQYAYSFVEAPGDSGWANLGNVSGNLYSAGQAAEIPAGGGTMTFSGTAGYDASFDVGLTATPVSVGALAFSPAANVAAGTPVTVGAPVLGSAPLDYQWLTDGGGGGALTNIPGATGTNLSINTTGLALGAYNYGLIVTSGASAATNTAYLGITLPLSTASLYDVGASIVPETYDISQLTGGGTGDGLNYYDDNGTPPGQTFTTGANSQGYYLTSVTVGTGNQSGGTSGHTSPSLKPYTLQVYQVAGGSTAVLIASYTNSSFSFTFGDWLTWSGFSPLFLKPNTTYAYSFHLWPTSEGGWAAMSIAQGNPYADGQAGLFPVGGGTIAFGGSGLSDAAFDLGLTPVGIAPTVPFANTITVSPSRAVTIGTQVTLNEAATGAAPLHYQWQTDGGSGGALTNIPSANATTLVQNTTGWNAGVYQYEVIVTNSYGSSTSVAASLVVSYPAVTAMLADIGAAVPQPAPLDIAQANPASSPNKPDGLNYYYNSDTPPGQTFVTGGNPGGYKLNTVAISLAGDANLGSQTYVLRIYTVSDGYAVLYATYNSQSNFLISAATDCLQWSGLALPLSPNITYAYTLYGPDGWDNLANVSGNPYADGEVCLIPPNGGVVTYGSSHSYDGVFVLGLTLPGYPVVDLPAFSPSSPVYAGTPVVASASVSGNGPFTYYWQTDGGSGVFTNIPGATSPTLTVNTAPLGGLTVGYDLVVANGSGTTTGEVSELTILPPQAPTAASDITNSLYQLASQVTAFVGGTAAFSDTYFQGSLPITYQWQTDGGTLTYTNIPGATNDTLTLSNLAVSASGNYLLLAANSQGSAQTSAANLTVLPQPTDSFIVNFQYQTLVNADVGNYTGLGVIGTGTYWNQVMGTTVRDVPGAYYTSSSGYSDDGTTNRGLSWTIICNDSWGWSSSPTIALLDSGASAYIPSSFIFTLPDGLYNLALFSCNGTEAGNGQGGAVFTVNGVSQSTLPTTDTSFMLNTNYVVFTNVVVSGSSLAGTWYGPVNYGSLNGAQIQYLGPYAPLSIQATNRQLKLQWSPGTLLEATNLAGPWTTNTAQSPYLVTPAGGQQFFRVKVQ